MKQKGPVPLGKPGLCGQSLEGARLGVDLSRNTGILAITLLTHDPRKLRACLAIEGAWGMVGCGAVRHDGSCGCVEYGGFVALSNCSCEPLLERCPFERW